MTKTTEGQEVSTQEVAFEVYGTHARVSVPAGLVPRVVDQLPLHATRCEPQPGGRRFALDRAEAGGYEVLDEGVVQARTPVLDNALAFLRYWLFDYAVHHARDHLIVSAGVVGCEGRAIVLPGPTRVGKTMLVAALLRAGAVYYADDWAILDARGQVHPYPTPLFRLGAEKSRPRASGPSAARARSPSG